MRSAGGDSFKLTGTPAMLLIGRSRQFSDELAGSLSLVSPDSEHGEQFPSPSPFSKPKEPSG